MLLCRRRFSLACLGLAAGLVSCGGRERSTTGRLTIGLVSYEQGARSVEQYTQFNEILAEATHSLIELEVAFNERKALEELQRQSWSMVFASPGLTAIAIDQYRYIPLFPQLGQLIRSLLVVKEDSPLTTLNDLTDQTVALGQVGSATGYYLPLYDLYGLTLAEIRFASTPSQILEWVQEDEVVAGALGRDQYNDLRRQGLTEGLRILHTSRPIPPGSLLLGPSVDRNLQEVITRTLNEIPPNIAEDAGYIPNADPPDYRYLIELVSRVRPLEGRLRETPVRLFEPNPAPPEDLNLDLQEPVSPEDLMEVDDSSTEP